MADSASRTERKDDVVETSAGLISGSSSGGTTAFLGVPYAAPPVGVLRWKPPRSLEPWHGIRRCDSFSPACPQPKSPFYNVGETNEDCLYLNIWVPEKRRHAKMPVMVWVHGGAFLTGAGSLDMYDGRNLAEKGVVVVTINYRLGPLGFFAHPALSSESAGNVSGNYGLLDQISALRWVRRNIEAFGGDSASITAFGESAGAVSICNLMVSPLGKGLFERAIVQSAPLWVKEGLPSAFHTLESAQRTGIELAQALDCGGEDALEHLREVPADEIIAVAQPHEGFMPKGMQFGPVIDGWLLPDDPSKLIARGNLGRLPIVVGSNSEEARLFMAGMEVPAGLFDNLARAFFKDDAEEIKKMFLPEDSADPKQALEELVTVLEFEAPSRFVARSASAAGAHVFRYLFTAFPSADPLGACHGAEIRYVFGNLEPSLGFIKEDERISDVLINYWTNFAGSGDPNGEGLPDWLEYRTPDGYTIELGTKMRAAEALHPEACDLAEKVHAAQADLT